MAQPRGLHKAIYSRNGNRRVRSCGSMVYVRISPSCLLPLLIVSSMVSWIGKECALVRVITSTVFHFKSYSSVQPSSKRSGTCVKLDWLPSPSFILISVILPSRMCAACYPPSLSNSPVDPTIFLQFSLSSFQHTIMDPNNPARRHL